jgi:hypothetical protein
MANHVAPQHANALSFWEEETSSWVLEASAPIGVSGAFSSLAQPVIIA